MKKNIFWLLLVFLFCGCEKDEKPAFVVSESELVFNGIETKTLTLSVEPFKKCYYQITSCPDWLEISPNGGVIERDETQELSITPIYDLTIRGVLEDKIVLYSTLGEKIIDVKGIIDDVVYYLFPEELSIDAIVTSAKFSIENKGNMDFSYSLETEHDFISITKPTGNIRVSEYQEIEIIINREKMSETKEYESAIILKVNENTDTIKVVINHIKENKIHLTSNVVDAEYSRKRKMLVFVSSYPDKLYMFHTQTDALESIDLGFVPTCVSISPDEDFAVVGHDARISYINLNSKSVIRTYNIQCDVFDIVFGDNNWAYVFPKSAQTERIRCVDLSIPSTNETSHTGSSIWYQLKAKLSPEGGFIYAIPSPYASNIFKFSIQSGTAHYLYSKYNQGNNYTNEGNLWFSEDGKRIFTNNCLVFTTSESESEDLGYDGTIYFTSFNYPSIHWLDHSDKSGNLYILFSDGYYYNTQIKPFVYIFNENSLAFKSSIELEQFRIISSSGLRTYDAIPYFVFSNSNGNEIVTVSKADYSNPEYWAIEKIKIN
ncbi:MAG: hypothetical protein FWH18_12405 [Marinilabiliaceae bacterium]|nr:hypothetical protein [Marinilabiliaceae bacterium]